MFPFNICYISSTKYLYFNFLIVVMLLNPLLLDNYSLILYNLQQKVFSLFFLEINSITPLILLLFFLGGFLTILNPCFVSILPLSFSYFNTNYNIKINKFFFILGLLTNLILIMISSNFISYSYNIYLTRIPFISFWILLILSLNLLQIINFSSFFKFFYIDFNDILKKKWQINSYIIGVIIGFSSLPCSSPIIILVSFLLYHTNKLWLSLFCFFFYLLGCLIPLSLIFTLFIDYLQVYIMSLLWNIITPLI